MRTATIQNVDQEGRRIQNPIRYTGNLPGRFYLEKWHWAADRGHFMPQCAATLVTPERVVITCATPGEVGARAFVYLEDLGLIRGVVTRVIGARIHLDIETDANTRNRIAASILWLERRTNFNISDKRLFPRYQPKNASSSISMAEGKPIPCSIFNLSPTGAAVNSDLRPPLRDRVELGQVPGEVIRHTDIGFAMTFLKVQDPRVLEELLAPLPAVNDAFQLDELHIVA